MKDELKQTAEAIASHPKASALLTTAFVSNAWIDYGEPIIKGLTSIIGLTVLVVLLIKHILDIKKDHFTKDE